MTTTPYATPDGEFQGYVMSLFRDYVECSAGLQEFLLSTATDGRGTTLRRQFEYFYHAFLKLYTVTRPKIPQETPEEKKIRQWLTLSHGVLTRKNNQYNKTDLAKFAQDGCNIANEWIRLLYEQQIIKTSRL